jgi:hypothetical protein
MNFDYAPLDRMIALADAALRSVGITPTHHPYFAAGDGSFVTGVVHRITVDDRDAARAREILADASLLPMPNSNS